MATAIMYPPYIDEKLPAQTGDVFRIPFQLSRATGSPEGISLQIRTISTNILKLTTEASKITKIDNRLYMAEFKIDIEQYEFIIGQYYKAQLAYVSGEKTGIYSTVGIFKYTAIPEVEILDVNRETFDKGSPTDVFIGHYSSSDSNEKVEKYRFVIYNDDKIFHDTGFLRHDSSTDTSANESLDFCELKKEFTFGQNYSIRYFVITNNQIEKHTKEYFFTKKPNKTIHFPGGLKVHMDKTYTEAYFKIAIYAKEDSVLNGTYRLVRTSDQSGYRVWDTLKTFRFRNQPLVPGHINEITLFKDFLIEQGINYRYAIQQMWGDLHSRRIVADKAFNGMDEIELSTFYSDYEDTFLYDGEKQLKIRYNPKVSSFKNDILESKTDTIGGKYPYFFRNGYVKYKEFPISGLLSCLTDEDNLFIPKVMEYLSEDLTGEMMELEREFKLTALEWLTNGKPKFFKSPAEGVYIVKLLNVSMTPVDALGRMIHSFNSNAYEFDECTFENLIKYGFLDDSMIMKSPIQYESFKMRGTPKLNDKHNLTYSITYKVPDAITAIIRNAYIFSNWVLTYKDGTKATITIGYTETYKVPIKNTNPLVKVEAYAEITKNREDYIYMNGNTIGILDYGFYRKLDEEGDNLVPYEIYQGNNTVIENTDNLYDYLAKRTHLDQDDPNFQGKQFNEIEGIASITIYRKLQQEVYLKNGNPQYPYLDRFFRYPITDYDIDSVQYFFVKDGKRYMYLNNEDEVKSTINEFDKTVEGAIVETEYNESPLGLKQDDVIEESEDFYRYSIDDRTFCLREKYIEIRPMESQVDDYFPKNIKLAPGLGADIIYYYSVIDKPAETKEE